MIRQLAKLGCFMLATYGGYCVYLALYHVPILVVVMPMCAFAAWSLVHLATPASNIKENPDGSIR